MLDHMKLVASTYEVSFKEQPAVGIYFQRKEPLLNKNLLTVHKSSHTFEKVCSLLSEDNASCSYVSQ